MDKKKKQYRTAAIVGLITIATYLIANYAIPRFLVTLTKAAPATKASITDSYVIGEKILAKADGVDICRINVFVLDKKGKGVIGKKVTVEGLEGIEEVKGGISDNNGKASFEVRSEVEGQYVLNAYIDGLMMQQEIRVTFRN